MKYTDEPKIGYFANIKSKGKKGFAQLLTANQVATYCMWYQCNYFKRHL